MQHFLKQSLINLKNQLNMLEIREVSALVSHTFQKRQNEIKAGSHLIKENEFNI